MDKETFEDKYVHRNYESESRVTNPAVSAPKQIITFVLDGFEMK